ncbi:MAG TPA: TIGR04442 family protein [Geobacteraceae bacterium]|nr:TIGR04442 family protein [Geobacteraceae bacterium]
MYKDIRLHGSLENRIEYYAVAAGVDAHKRYFFNLDQSSESELRFFSANNEFVIGRQGITHRGNGGSFCEYMFGVDQPLTDMAKGDVINRLVMYGTHIDQKAGTLRFSNRTDGSLSYDKIFFDGNAVTNYFFFLHSEEFASSIQEQQEVILRRLGKTLKRSLAIGNSDDNRIIADILGNMGIDGVQLFLFKLINNRHEEYRNAFQNLYFRSKRIADDEFAQLTELASRNGIDRYQQERIRIDVMYKHPDNRRIVDEYRNILCSCNIRGEINRLENARLTRLKTLSVRNKIPGALFYTLDELLRKDRKLVETEESDYISETRQILEGIFFSERQIESRVDREDMLKLLHAKKLAAEHRNHSFEEILLDASKACDENIRDGADISLLEEFSYIITYLDRYDTTSQVINQLAFMENVRISEEMLRSILGNKKEFDTLRQNLFNNLFIDGVMENKYLGKYGRKKLATLVQGLEDIEAGRRLSADVLEQLQAIDREEQLFLVLMRHIRERIRNFYSKFNTKDDQITLKREVEDELHSKKLLKGQINNDLFYETILTIQKEAIYLHNLLPQIIAEKDISLREDFLDNSGLDRFYVEELELEYFELNGLPLEDLYQIRKGLN